MTTDRDPATTARSIIDPNERAWLLGKAALRT
jgi:hypothetical protein